MSHCSVSSPNHVYIPLTKQLGSEEAGLDNAHVLTEQTSVDPRIVCKTLVAVTKGRMTQKIRDHRDRKKKLQHLEEQASVEKYQAVIRHNKRVDFTDDMNELAAVQCHQDVAAHGEKMAATDDVNNLAAAQNFQDVVSHGEKMASTDDLNDLAAVQNFQDVVSHGERQARSDERQARSDERRAQIDELKYSTAQRDDQSSIRREKLLELEEKAVAQDYQNSLLQGQILKMKQKYTNDWIMAKVEEGIKEREDAIRAQVTEELLSKDPDAIKRQRIAEADRYVKAKKNELHAADERFKTNIEKLDNMYSRFGPPLRQKELTQKLQRLGITDLVKAELSKPRFHA